MIHTDASQRSGGHAGILQDCIWTFSDSETRVSKRLPACFLSVQNSDEEIEITYFPGSGPVEVQEDLMHLAFQVESMEEFQKHLESCH